MALIEKKISIFSFSSNGRFHVSKSVYNIILRENGCHQFDSFVLILRPVDRKMAIFISI